MAPEYLTSHTFHLFLQQVGILPEPQRSRSVKCGTVMQIKTPTSMAWQNISTIGPHNTCPPLGKRKALKALGAALIQDLLWPPSAYVHHLLRGDTRHGQPQCHWCSFHATRRPKLDSVPCESFPKDPISTWAGLYRISKDEHVYSIQYGQRPRQSLWHHTSVTSVASTSCLSVRTWQAI